jgi:hypothetical protein
MERSLSREELQTWAELSKDRKEYRTIGHIENVGVGEALLALAGSAVRRVAARRPRMIEGRQPPRGHHLRPVGATRQANVHMMSEGLVWAGTAFRLPQVALRVPATRLYMSDRSIFFPIFR